MHSHHSAAAWQAFRLFMFEHDGGVCCHCGRSLQKRVFQVHHKRYVAGKEPWEYPPSACETLEQAKAAAFDVIERQNIKEWLAKHSS